MMNFRKKSTRPASLQKLFHTFPLIILSVVLMSGCRVKTTEIPVEIFESHSYQPFPTNKPEISAIEGNAEIKFPPSAHEIYAYTTGLRDIFIQVRFSMQSNELIEFMNSTLCNQPLAKAVSTQTFSPNLEWWIPYQAQDLEQCYGEHEHSHQQIIVDMTNKDIYIVYVTTSTY